MSFESHIQDIVAFVRENQAWAPFIVGLLAFGESLAVISFIVPATGILVAIGALMGAADLPFWPVWLGAVIGAICGDWLSYWVGITFKDDVLTRWPLKNYPTAIQRATDFTQRWGAWGVFFGRFSGPLRAFVPLAAGLFAMPQFLFQMANIASAMVWGFVLLAPGDLMARYWMS